MLHTFTSYVVATCLVAAASLLLAVSAGAKPRVPVGPAGGGKTRADYCQTEENLINFDLQQAAKYRAAGDTTKAAAWKSAADDEAASALDNGCFVGDF
jgi:hypothetical protein